MALTLDCLKRSCVAASTSERGRKLWADMTPTPLHAGETSPKFAMPLQDSALSQTHSLANCVRQGQGCRWADEDELEGADALKPGQERRSKGRRHYTVSTTASFLEFEAPDSAEDSTDISDEDAHHLLSVGRSCSLESNVSVWTVKNTFINLQDEADPASPCALPKRYISAPVLMQLSPTGVAKVHERFAVQMDYDLYDALATSEGEFPEMANGAQPTGKAAKAAGYPSIGSMQHHLGNCKPCAWFYKPQGCQNGVECRHCHACPKGEIRRRKKDRVSKGKSSDEQ